jgi:hypothetical protein
MAKSKTQKRKEGEKFAGQITSAVSNEGAWNKDNEAVNPKLGKLSDKQVKSRLKNQRPDVKGLRSELKSLKQAPTTRNLVPGADGTMTTPNPNKEAKQALRQQLSGFRPLRQEASRRDILPKPANADKKQSPKWAGQGRPPAPASPPAMPAPAAAPNMGTATGTATPPGGAPAGPAINGPLRPPRPRPGGKVYKRPKPRPGRVATPRGY